MAEAGPSSLRNEATRRDFRLSSPHYSASPSKRRLFSIEQDELEEEEEDAVDDSERFPDDGSMTMIDPAILREQEEQERQHLLQEIERETASLKRTEGKAASLRKGIENTATTDLHNNNTGLIPGISATHIPEDESELESLEAMLREMDDGALSALLTNDTQANTLRDLIPLLPKEAPPTILPPARSAGTEGLGSGLQLDEEVRKLADANTEDSLNRLVEETLRDRLKRGEELAKALSTFTGIKLESVESSEPKVQKSKQQQQQQRSVRHITIRGTLLGDLGSIVLDLDVQESQEDQLPQIITLDIEVDDAVYFAIGGEKINLFVESVNLPAVLLAIQTMIPIAVTRFRLFGMLCQLYPDLTAQKKQELEKYGINFEQSISHSRRKRRIRDILRDLPPVSTLLDPKLMETLSLENSIGARLDIIFRIQFNQYGHANSLITIKPSIPEQYIEDEDAQDFINEMPDNFHHFIAHRPSYIDIHGALVAVIDSFFRR